MIFDLKLHFSTLNNRFSKIEKETLNPRFCQFTCTGRLNVIFKSIKLNPALQIIDQSSEG